jgi:hypothetical protein
VIAFGKQILPSYGRLDCIVPVQLHCSSTGLRAAVSKTEKELGKDVGYERASAAE